MKFAMFRQDLSLVPCLVVDEELILLGSVAKDLVELIEGGDEAIASVRDASSRRDTPRVRLATDKLGPPITRFHSDIMCTGWNYHDHFEEGRTLRERTERPTAPTFFTKRAGTVIGPEDPIQIDSGISPTWDYEAEIAVVVGTAGQSLTPQSAADHVFGYLLANDVSQRDLQRRHGGQWFKGKSLDRTMPLGPFLLTRDEIDLSAVMFELFRNGTLLQTGVCKDMAFSVPELLSELSLGMTLLPGDVLLTGTPAGVGQSRTPQVFLAHGDLIEIRSGSLGRQRNRVTDIGLTAR